MFAQARAARAATSTTAALPVSVRRKRLSGVWRAWPQDVRPAPLRPSVSIVKSEPPPPQRLRT